MWRLVFWRRGKGVSGEGWEDSRSFGRGKENTSRSENSSPGDKKDVREKEIIGLYQRRAYEVA